MKLAKLILLNLTIATLSSAAATEKISVNIQSNHEIIKKLTQLALIKKDNFEKTSNFDKRLCEQTYKAFGVNDKTPITIQLEKLYSAHYDADKQVFDISLSPGGNHFKAGINYNDEFTWDSDFKPHKHYSFNIFKNSLETNSYIGKNAFGVSKEIKGQSETAVALYAPTKNANSTNKKIIYSVKPDDARRIAQDLRVAIITPIQPPCFVSGKGRSSPTLDNGYDITLTELSIVGAPNPEWVLYVNSTKEILKRGKFR
jgi:hypothetical protein